MESLCLFLCVSWALIKGGEMDEEGTRGYLAMNGNRSANLLDVDIARAFSVRSFI